MNPLEEIRFELSLQAFPNESSLRETCHLIYGTQDKNLIAAMSSTPYVVGRSFSRSQQEELTAQLKLLNVSFVFQSKPPYTERVSFDPLKPEASDGPSRSIRIPWKGFAIAAAISLALGGAVYFFPSIDLIPKMEMQSNKPPPSESEEDFDARLSQIQNRIEFRERSDLLWQNAKENQGLQREDSLRSYSQSSATLRYRDGSFVRMKENTLLVVGETHESTERGTERELELKDGSLQARMLGSTKPQSLSIHTPSGTLKVSNRNNNQPMSAQIATSFTEGKLEVTVSEGSAELMPRESTKEPVKIQNQKVLIQEAGAPPRIEDYRPELQLISPQRDAKLKFSENQNSFQFKWEALGDSYEYTWSLYSDPLGKNLLLTQKTSQAEVELNYLDVGTLYWQVEAQGPDKESFTSEVRSLYVEKDNN